MKEGWVVKTSQLEKHLKSQCGRDKIYRMIKQCIDAGYMKKEFYSEKGLQRFRYVVSEFPKFKKCLPLPENPEADNQETVYRDAVFPHAKEDVAYKN